VRARVQKWGNSLALRIPKSFATEVGLDRDAPVEVTLVDGKILISPIYPPIPTLEELVAGITEENRHDEIDTGPSVGREAW
jgi:antitoxin MazE